MTTHFHVPLSFQIEIHILFLIVLQSIVHMTEIVKPCLPTSMHLANRCTERERWIVSFWKVDTALSKF